MTAEKKLSRAIRLICAGSLVLGVLPAQAQSDATVPERVEITGSRIPVADTAGASSTVTLGDVDLRADGRRNVEDVLDNLPQVFASQGAAISNGATGTATIDLRHMGVQRTLVLVDGKRLPPGSVLNLAADLNEVPPPLIRRIDVLTGGAGAVYGSGAVAGVVNIFLKDDFAGVEVDTNLSGASHGQHNAEVQALARAKAYALPDGPAFDARKRDASLLAGANFAEGRGNATVFVSHRHADALLEGARDYSACTLGPANPGLACSGSTTSVARLGAYTPDANGNPRPYTDADAYNFGPLNFYQRPSDAVNAAALLHLDLLPAARLYNEFAWHHHHTDAQVAPGGIFFGQQASIAYDNPLLNAAWRTALGLKQPGDVVKVLAGKRNTEGDPRNTSITDESVRYLLGVKGRLGAWDYDVFAQFGRVGHRDLVTGYFSSTRIVRALDVVTDANGKPACRAAVSGIDPACVPYDLIHPGAITRAALDYLAAAGASAGATRNSVAGIHVAGDLGNYGARLPWAARAAGVSLGAEQRTESLDFTPDAERRSGDLSGAGGASQPMHGAIRTPEGFGEFRLPLVDGAWLARRLDLSGSYRRAHYSWGPGTNTEGLGLEWEPAAWLRVHGSAQRAERAPSLLELYTPAQVVLNGPTADPCGGTVPRATLAACLNTGLPAALYGKVPANSTSQYNGRIGGNASLRPETARTATLGVTIAPDREVALTLDAYRIKVKDAIQPYNAQVVFNQCLATGDGAYCQLIHRDSAGSLWLSSSGWVDTGTTNIGSQATSGVDVGAAWRLRLAGRGSLAFALNGTWVHSFTVENLPGAGSYGCAGLYGATCGLPLPAWRHKLRTTWTSPWNADLSVTWRYLDRVRNDKLSSAPLLAATLATPRDSYLASRSYLDLNAQLRLSGSVRFALGINNLLDKDPPFASSSSVTGFLGNGNTYPQLYDAYGRVAYCNLTVRF